MSNVCNGVLLKWNVQINILLNIINTVFCPINIFCVMQYY